MGSDYCARIMSDFDSKFGAKTLKEPFNQEAALYLQETTKMDSPDRDLDGPGGFDSDDIDMHLRIESEMEQEYEEEADQRYEADQCPIEQERHMSIECMASLESLKWVEGTGSQCKMIENAQLKSHQVHIAADVPIPLTNKTVKKYVSLPTHRNLVHILYDCYKNNKPCPINELINRDTECRVYVDCEWYEKECSGHSRITSLVELLTLYLKETHGFEPIIVVSNSSRQKDGQWKQSWHLTVTNASFSSNKGEMKSFMNRFKEHHQNTEILWLDSVFLVDMTVYTNNRVIRTPLSFKEEDPLKTKMMPCKYDGAEWVTHPITDEEQLLDYLITYLPDDVIRLPDSKQCTTTDYANLGKTTNKKRKRDTVLQAAEPSNRHRLIPSEVQEHINTLLTIKGCSHSVTDSLVDGYVIRLKNGNGSRCPLLLSNDDPHTSNNQYITLHDGACNFKCHSDKCKGKTLGIGCLTPALLQQLNPVAESIDATLPSDCVDTPDDMVLGCLTPVLSIVQQLNPVTEVFEATLPSDCVDIPDDMVLDVTDEDTTDEQLPTQLTDDTNEPTPMEEEPATKKAKKAMIGQPPKKKDKKGKAAGDAEKTAKSPKKDRVQWIDPDTAAINASINATNTQIDDYDLSYIHQADCSLCSLMTHHVYCAPR